MKKKFLITATLLFCSFINASEIKVGVLAIDRRASIELYKEIGRDNIYYRFKYLLTRVSSINHLGLFELDGECKIESDQIKKTIKCGLGQKTNWNNFPIIVELDRPDEYRLKRENLIYSLEITKYFKPRTGDGVIAVCDFKAYREEDPSTLIYEGGYEYDSKRHFKYCNIF